MITCLVTVLLCFYVTFSQNLFRILFLLHRFPDPNLEASYIGNIICQGLRDFHPTQLP